MPIDDDDKTVLKPSRRPAPDDDRTVLRPRPGGRARGAPAPAPRTAPGGAAAPRREEPAYQPGGGRPAQGAGLNPLVDAAATLLALATQLRATVSHPDVPGLRDRLVREVKSFENAARSAGTPAATVLAARYGLCTVLDEFVQSTPWGSGGQWGSQSLLSTFHNETFGGEKFFQILDRMAQEPATNIDLLELYYICLMLGFEGKYRVVERGRSQLEQVQENLYRTIRMQRGDFERALSPRWEGVRDRRNALVRYVPLWVVGALAGLLLLALYIGFSFSLNGASDPVFAQVQGLERQRPPAVVSRPLPPPPPTAVPEKGLRDYLAPEIQQGAIELTEQPDRTTITIHGDGLFASGSASVKPELFPLLSSIGAALDKVQGRVLITGHTDSVPIRTLRFPSNWHLSQARAESVRKVLAGAMSDPSRLKAEGRADTEPVAPNDTPANRARNRRVEITLMAGGGQ